MLKNFSTSSWGAHYPDFTQNEAINSLEQGSILYFPELAFKLNTDETQFLTPDCADPKSKNIGFDSKNKRLWGVRNLSVEQQTQLKIMLGRFSGDAYNLIKQLLPRYADQLTTGRTSYRPVQIIGRQSSYRKDDKRLHVDAFPSSPNQGNRILRVFCNINPTDEPRVWRIGEPFEQVAKRFIPHISKPFPGTSALLRLLKITKSYRTLYDHYMLHMHDNMKADDAYQKTAQQEEIRFPTGSSWIVQTDHVSHAAMSGQYLLEQTFYLPVKAMRNEALSPLRTLESLLKQRLV
jgi:hypothetical protein